MVNGIFTIPLPGPLSRSADELNSTGPRISEFVAGPENLLVAEALRACLARTAAEYDPLVLYGPHGSGKSHLARGLADWWQQHFPDARVVCLAGSEFAQAYAAALADQQLDAWRDEIRSANLLILEDLGQLNGKRPAQNELLHTLDAVREHGCQVVVTARTLPTHWATLLPGLRSRLSAGLAVPLVLPAPNTRRVILEKVAAARGMTLSPPTLRSLAEGLDATVPELIAAILELELSEKSSVANPQSGRLEPAGTRSTARTPLLREIAARTAKYFGLKVADLKSASRQQRLVAARSLAMYLARTMTSHSYDQIGLYFGGRDHTTVIHGYRRTEKLIGRDPATRQSVRDLQRMLVDA